jgi:cathepsin L
MDCSWANGNNACYGGDHSSSYDFVISQGGAWPTEEEYPYTMNEGYCVNHTSSRPRGPPGSSPPVKLVSYQYVIGEHALMDALANHGPVAVAMSTIPMSAFSFYHSGVYRNPLCNPLIPDHIVLAVGYGTDEDGGDFWILKNQWSKYWGEGGYMRISRAWDDCGVATMGVLPIVA